MPLYEYQCDTCGHRFERIQKFSDPPVAICPVDGGPVKKLLSSPAIQFKGSGWYITDYARKPSSGDSKQSSASKDSTSDGAATESATTGAKDTTSSAPAKAESKKESKKE